MQRKPPNAGKGRKKGVPNKITGEVKAMVLQALANAGGVDYLEQQARANPTAFLTLLGKILPLQVTGSEGQPLVPSVVQFLVTPQPGAEVRE